MLTYISLDVRMILGLASQSINLEKFQLLIVSDIARFATLLVVWWISMEQTAPSKPLVGSFNWFEVLDDVVLLIIASGKANGIFGGKIRQILENGCTGRFLDLHCRYMV
ncbi:hypothetical protein [Anabaena sp. CS-542/02]|uniref:hypothetical protein n=1 Tax=Anabaena sp. CS-542/02 TaxID=3021719 RepID=UPI002330D895|nr:hypothetical protein [Anabaena sp. CS-542/02]MDB9445932.1 hypothetical protein [Anabaena sp. CS-542/02]